MSKAIVCVIQKGNDLVIEEFYCPIDIYKDEDIEELLNFHYSDRHIPSKEGSICYVQGYFKNSLQGWGIIRWFEKEGWRA